MERLSAAWKQELLELYECPVSMEPMSDAVSLEPCGHELSEASYENTMKDCPLCREKIQSTKSLMSQDVLWYGYKLEKIFHNSLFLGEKEKQLSFPSSHRSDFAVKQVCLLIRKN